MGAEKGSPLHFPNPGPCSWLALSCASAALESGVVVWAFGLRVGPDVTFHERSGLRAALSPGTAFTDRACKLYIVK